jgi:pyridoxine kinase
VLASADKVVLDPVMGDNGKLYIPEDEVPEYKSLLREADLILPNQFEAAGHSLKPPSTTSTVWQLLSKSCTQPTVSPTSLSPPSVLPQTIRSLLAGL